MSDYISIATCNLKDGGSPDLLALLRSLDVDLLLLQELKHHDEAADGGAERWRHALDALGMQGIRGRGPLPTGVLHRPGMLMPGRRYTDPGTAWWLEPTALQLRLHGTVVPIVAASAHLNYASPTDREREAGSLTRYHDKRVNGLPGTDGRAITLPCLIGVDCNSYPHEPVAGDPRPPRLEEIRDKPHRAHRGRWTAGGEWVPDTEPDRILRTAGLDDLARSRALDADDRRGLAATVPGRPTHGPETRIDRLYASPRLRTALVEVDVIDTRGLSDHRIVRARFSSRQLTAVLSNWIAWAA